jgi:3-dehydroshikimate dehydratase
VAEGLRPGLCSVTLRDQSAIDVIAVASRAGLEAIEWGGDRHVRPDDPGHAAVIGRRTRDAGLRSASYGSYLFAPTATASDIVAVLDTTVALEAPNLRVWTDWVGPDPEPRVREAIHAQLVLIAGMAADRDLTVSIEFHPGTLTETAASTLTLLEAVGAANLFTYWQPPTGLGVPELLASWRAVRHRASHLHVFRWRTYDDRQPLAEGDDLWPQVFAEPPAAPGWTGDAVAFLEFVRDDDPAQVERDAEVLRRWLERSRS